MRVLFDPRSIVQWFEGLDLGRLSRERDFSDWMVNAPREPGSRPWPAPSLPKVEFAQRVAAPETVPAAPMVRDQADDLQWHRRPGAFTSKMEAWKAAGGR